MKVVCVFCGSSQGRRPVFVEAAHALGEILARQGYTLVYGGGNVGLMGTVADAALQMGGEVLGVIPDFLESRELAHRGLTRLEVVGSMHLRKARMAELADAFVALPGGFGTLDEFCEILTWAQLGLHGKPTGLLNVDGYFTPLLTFFDGAVADGFVSATHRRLVIEDTEPLTLLSRLAACATPETGRAPSSSFQRADRL